jgi:prolyl-tRNA synthetase
MRASNYFIPTTKEDPSDAVVASHKLMVRAGLIRKSASGLYHYLPMGFKVLKKIEAIIREEMDISGALEFQLPILTPSEIWEQSGRWERMGKEMFRIKDRHDVSYSLGPTHEESFTSLLKPILKSYKDLPKNVYQIHTKFRDEIRPRFGVIRSREFIMKDAYSFHNDSSSLDETYETMRKTYRNIFQRCGLKTIPVQADSGSMGGSGSEEFMVVSPIGEETLSLCNSCGYSGNVEKTPVLVNYRTDISKDTSEKIHTPSISTIDQVAKFFSVNPSNTIKAVYLNADNKWNVLIFIRGDREINEVKVNNFLNSTELRPLSSKECEDLDLVIGFTGPKKEFSKNIKVFYDFTLDPNESYIVGSNEVDYHTKGFVLSKEIGTDIKYRDFTKSVVGDKCPSCGNALHQEKGIEVGHIFKLGDKYSKAFDLKISDKNGKLSIPTMGCYGIGVNRTMATVIEQCNDDKGIFWPISISPFEISLVGITKDSTDFIKVEEIYMYLKSKNLDVFWDDRELGAGFKFKDSELIGFPIRITIGKNFFDKNEISLLNRKTGKEETFLYTGNENLVTKVEELRANLYSEISG